jgi:hypothetical protein
MIAYLLAYPHRYTDEDEAHDEEESEVNDPEALPT